MSFNLADVNIGFKYFDIFVIIYVKFANIRTMEENVLVDSIWLLYHVLTDVFWKYLFYFVQHQALQKRANHFYTIQTRVNCKCDCKVDIQEENNRSVSVIARYIRLQRCILMRLMSMGIMLNEVTRANHVSYLIVKWHLMQTKMTTLPDEATSASVIADAHALYCNSGRNDLNSAI